MKNKPDRYRKNIRLKNYDYSSAGYYFVTIVSHNRKNIFGEIIDSEIILNPLGRIVENTWQEMPTHFPYVNVDSYVVMPNHFHGIVIINEEIIGAQHAEPLPRTEPLVKAESLQQMNIQPLGVIVRSFKSAVTKRVHDLGLFVGEKIWQRNYYEHIIRDEDDYQKIFDYISSNPLNWEYDNENPDNI
jgi:REP element-mobilizing transposase RayT